jgi:hypothetical protein
MSLDQNLKGWAQNFGSNTSSHSPPANVWVGGRGGGEREKEREKEKEKKERDIGEREREIANFFKYNPVPTI